MYVKQSVWSWKNIRNKTFVFEVTDHHDTVMDLCKVIMVQLISKEINRPIKSYWGYLDTV